MKKLIAIGLVVVLALTLGVTPVFAGIGKDIKDMGDNGKHYNLNIIGVQKDKKVDMTDSNRHTIFVPLDKNGNPSRTVKIIFAPNEDDPTAFQVEDGNATDGSATVLVPYEWYSNMSFNVYATALGKPNRSAYVHAYVEFGEYTFAFGDDFLLQEDFTLTRGKGKPKPVNISDIFRASGWIDVEPYQADPSLGPGPEDITFNNVWLFNVPTLEEYYWDYMNSGLKLMQIRFYPTTSGSWTNVPD